VPWSAPSSYRTAAHTYGRFEARIQFAGGDGVISSFFLWKPDSEQSDVYWNELDFEKLGGACELQTNSIYGLPQSNHEEEGYALVGLCEGYHTYAYEWTPQYIAWLVDGAEIRRDTGVDAASYAENATEGMQFRFNIWPGNASFGGNFSEGILPVYQFVAWAQYSEYTPGSGDDGSDFTLAWREEFDIQPAGWQAGSWASPLNGSTHSAQNLAFVDGIAVLALTADDATGYSDTPPADSPGAAGAPGTGAGGVTPIVPDPAGDEGCGCRLVRDDPRRSGPVVLLACAALGWIVRRRARADGRRSTTTSRRVQ
jgi:endo-1,3-1,4-beta-glycanase ExoK